MNIQTIHHSTTIRRILYGNAIFSGLSGLLFVFASNPIAQFIRIETPFIVLGIGLGLVGYAALIYVNASRKEVTPSFVLFTTIADSAWVVLSILLLITGWVPFSAQGKWAIGILAAIVDIFATLQFIEWRRMEIQ